MAALPIYVHVPKFYADTLGLSLAGVGAILLLARILDAVQDPLLGWWSDRRRAKSGSRWIFVGAGTPFLALGMLGLFNPPALGTTGLGWWLVANLLVVYTAFSMVTVSYQAHGAEISDDIAQRTRITAWREGFALVGVFLAAALPEVLKRSAGERAGFSQFALLFAPLAIGLAIVTMRGSPPAHARVPPSATKAVRAFALPLRNALFRRLGTVFVLNGIAASIPATLVLFFIEDVVRRPDLAAAFLIAYFAAGAAGLPLWVWLSRVIGKGRAWLAGMVLSIAAFVWAFLLGPGDVAAYFAICVMSGVGLGADLALPPSILADVIDDDEARGKGRNEGAYFGLWNLATKMNLALAAGIALPLLQGFGYGPKTDNSTDALFVLAAVYALLPCALKAMAAAALVASPFIQEKSQ
ncbi:MAG: MFS transporter [Betaproteobacteria bacterium]|nr:MFS transporter [Betaproteobacteria bacterium]